MHANTLLVVNICSLQKVLEKQYFSIAVQPWQKRLKQHSYNNSHANSLFMFLLSA